jgi:hypothetical protein
MINTDNKEYWNITSWVWIRFPQRCRLINAKHLEELSEKISIFLIKKNSHRNDLIVLKDFKI